MRAKRTVRSGKSGYIHHGRFYTRRQWRAKWVTKNFKRKPRRQ